MSDVYNVGGNGRTSIERGVRGRAVLFLAEQVDVVDALSQEGYEVVTADSFCGISQFVPDDGSAVVLFDDSERDWLRTVADLRQQHPDVSLVMLADIDSADEFLGAVAAGVDGFCPAGSSTVAILRTVRSVETSGVAIPRSMVPPLVEHARHARGWTVHTAAGPIDVTSREWEILQMLLQRRTTREMSQELFVSVGTVRCHISIVLKKIGAVDRDDAIRLIERGRAS